MSQSVEYQWQSKKGKTWSNDGKRLTSFRRALRYLDVAAKCNDCDEHRLIMNVYTGLTLNHRIRLLYTLNSRPKGL